MPNIEKKYLRGEPVYITSGNSIIKMMHHTNMPHKNQLVVVSTTKVDSTDRSLTAASTPKVVGKKKVIKKTKKSKQTLQPTVNNVTYCNEMVVNVYNHQQVPFVQTQNAGNVSNIIKAVDAKLDISVGTDAGTVYAKDVSFVVHHGSDQASS